MLSFIKNSTIAAYCLLVVLVIENIRSLRINIKDIIILTRKSQLSFRKALVEVNVIVFEFLEIFKCFPHIKNNCWKVGSTRIN